MGPRHPGHAARTVRRPRQRGGEPLDRTRLGSLKEQTPRAWGSTLTAGLFYGYVVASHAKTGVNFRLELTARSAHTWPEIPPQGAIAAAGVIGGAISGNPGPGERPDKKVAPLHG